MPSTSLKLLNLNQEHPDKKIVFFWSNLYKAKVTTTSLKEMLELLNFGQMATCKL